MSIDTERLNVQASVSDTRVRIVLDGENGNIIAGGNGADGDLILIDDQDRQRVHIDSDLGNVYIYNEYNNASEKKKRIRIMGQTGNIDCGGGDKDGDLILRDADGNIVIHIDAGKQNIYIKNADGTKVMELGRGGNIIAGGGEKDGDLILRDGDGNNIIQINADKQNIVIKNTGGTKVMELGRDGNIYAGGGGKDGDLVLRTGGDPPRDRIHLNADKANIWLGGNDADGDIVIFPRDATNRGERSNIEEATIHLDGDAGDIKLMGADCAEYFSVADSNKVESGAVLVANQARSLKLSNKAYDKRVVGVVSGAGELKPGIVLNKKAIQENGTPVALVGTVFCKVDAQYAEIEVGDLLTTSPTPGHAMKAVDPDKSFGAVLGKALDSQATGEGLIPVLVSLH